MDLVLGVKKVIVSRVRLMLQNVWVVGKGMGFLGAIVLHAKIQIVLNVQLIIISVLNVRIKWEPMEGNVPNVISWGVFNVMMIIGHVHNVNQEEDLPMVYV